MEPVIKMRRWDLDAAKVEEVRARQAVQDRARETQELGESIAEAETVLRRVHQDGASIDAQLYTTLAMFLSVRRQDFEDKMEELRDAQRAHDETQQVVLGAKQKLNAMEKHKEAKRQENEIENRREEQKQMDDLWLLRRERSE